MKIEMISPFFQPQYVAEIVDVYQQTFGNAPWNEGFKCTICDLVLPREGGPVYCPNCLSDHKLVFMVAYWPNETVLTDFYHEMKKPEALCLIAKEAEKVIAFTWGYQLESNAELDIKLDAPGVHNLVFGKFFYLDEVAVLPKFQGNGIGKKLVKEIFANQTEKKIILRTLAKSQMFNLISKMDGEVILPISRDRVIMSVSL